MADHTPDTVVKEQDVPTVHQRQRAVIREKSQLSENVRQSLQGCTIGQNMEVLNSHINKPNSKFNKDRLRGLRAVLEVLLTKLEGPDGTEHLKSFMTFEQAYEQYTGFLPDYIPGTHHKPEKKQFKELLCHPHVGLRVLIIYNPNTEHSFLCLRPDSADISGLIEALIKDDRTKYTRLEIEYETVQKLINSMDSEYDKRVAKALYCANLSRPEITRLGFRADDIPSLVRSITAVIEEIQNVEGAADDLLTLRLKAKKTELEKSVSRKEHLLEKQASNWPEHAISNLEKEIHSDKDHLTGINGLIFPQNAKDEAKRNSRKRRIAKQLIEEHRFKRRKLSNQGAPRLLDTDDEEFVAKCIEDKSTYHGRREEATMYTNRRVKCRDLLNIANYNLEKRGKKRIKSHVTVFNRSKPRNIRSMQSKRHITHNLFCCKKPPKAEDCSNENTHFQRAHVKYIKQSFFGCGMDESRKYCIMESTDDKAYLRPGTSEGFSNTRRGTILTITDEEKSRKLPKYDWPNTLVYQTPAAHRVFTKVPVEEDEGGEISDKLITDEDHHIVFVRPKSFVPSNGSVYKSETVKLRHDHPDIFEVKQDGPTPYSEPFRKACAPAHDGTVQFRYMQEPDDVKKVSMKKDCPHKEYHRDRLNHLAMLITKSVAMSAEITEEGEKKIFANRLIPLLDTLLQVINDALSSTESTPFIKKKFTKSLENVYVKCEEVIEVLKDLKLPSVKPRYAELTDAGPGQGVNNIDVRVRDAEISIIWNQDYRVRVHRSRGDSGQGEAERTNSAIQDSVVDGGTINWEYIKRFEDLTEDQADNMTIKEYEQYEKDRMEKNAWLVTEEVTKRIDEAPVLSTFIKAYKSEKVENHFFFNTENVKKYHSATPQAREDIPGAAVIAKSMQHFDQHYDTGELYMEYIRYGCEKKTGKVCSHCSKNDWVGPPAERIPQPKADLENPGHFLKFKDVPKTDRVPDDTQPRANLKKLFESGDLTPSSTQGIVDFSKKFCVKEKYVLEYLQHLSNLQRLQNMRKSDRQRTKAKSLAKAYSEYDWKQLVESGKLKSLYVAELDKYLEHHGLDKRGLKGDKIKAITFNIMRQDQDLNIDHDSSEPSEEETGSSEDEIVAAVFGSSSESSSESGSDSE